METTTDILMLKNVQSGLTQQDTAQKTQGIMLFGQDGTPNGKTLLNTKAIVDVKSGRPLSEVLEYITPAPASDLFVDMGLPSGLLWARRNIDATQANGFAASEYQYECSFFSWGNTDPHNPTSNSSFAPYSFGSANDQEPYVSSEGAKIGYPGVAGPSHDAARAIAGAPWRMPLTEDFAELFNSSYTKFIDADGNDIASDVTNKLITMNSIVGIRLKSKINGNTLFFPCSGYGSGSSWLNRGSYGVYWSRSLYSAAYGRGLYFSSGGVGPQGNDFRFYGFAVRPVQ